MHELIRLVFILCFSLQLILPAWAQAPAWWTTRGVLNSEATTDDYAAVNQGQVKHIAKQAYEEFEEKLPGGAGTALDAIWENPAAGTDDYTAINIGQLKNVAKPFYDRLIAESVVSAYPWGASTDDYALANIGQVKNLFSFSINSIEPTYYLNIVSGDRQIGHNEVVLPLPLTVRIVDSDGAPVSGVSVSFSILGAAGPRLGLNSVEIESADVVAVTSILGIAKVYLLPAGAIGSSNVVQAAASGQNVSFSAFLGLSISSSGGGSVVPTVDVGDAPAPGGTPTDANFYEATLNPLPNYGDTELLVSVISGQRSSPRLTWSDVSGVSSYLIQRRINLGEWLNRPLDINPVAGGYSAQDEGLLCGNLYEYRILAILPGGNAVLSNSGVYCVPMVESISYEYQNQDGTSIESPFFDFGPSYGFFVYSDEDIDADGFFERINYHKVLFNARAETLPVSSYLQYKYVPKEGGMMNESSEVVPSMISTALTELTVPNVESVAFMRILMDPLVSVLYGPGYVPSYALSGMGDNNPLPLSRIRIHDPIQGGRITWTGDPHPNRYSFQELIDDGFGVIDHDPLADGFILNWDGDGLEAKVSRATMDENYVWHYSIVDVPKGGVVMASDIIRFVPEADVDNNGRLIHISITPINAQMASMATSLVMRLQESFTQGANVPLNESAGAKYRKIALNGAPLSDEKPQQEAESGQSKEETFIDALTLGLRHDTTDTYMSVPASDLFLGARRSITSEVWNSRRGFAPDERPDRPFGTGWTSNLTAGIQFTRMIGSGSGSIDNPDTATVTDENGASHTFAILYPPNAVYSPETGYVGQMTFVPLPTSKHEQSTHLTSLVKDGANYVFKRKYGSKLTYAMSQLAVSIPSDRIDGSSSGQENKWARLVSVEDRYGNALDYAYSSDYTLIPATIKVRRSDGLGATLSIRQNEDGLITDVWDSKGYKVSYTYVGIGNAYQLTTVTASDGKVTTYDYVIDEEEDQSPDSVDPHHEPKFHFNLKKITDPLDHTYEFDYVFDHSKQDYSDGDYYTKTGLPMQVSKVTLPNEDLTEFENQSSVKLVRNTTTDKLEFQGVRRNRVKDAEGNQRLYNFTNTQVEEM
jgi:hypothetical protein